MQNPKRVANLQTSPLGEGLTVTNSEGRSLVLNATSAVVFQRCDGQTAEPQLVKLLEQRFGLTHVQAEALLSLTLDKLSQAKLIEGNAAPVKTRRRMLATALAMGLAAILAPRIAEAKCKDHNDHGDDDDDEDDRDEHDHGDGHGHRCTTTTTTTTPYY